MAFLRAIPLYDEIAYIMTPFTLVALTAEVIYQAGGDDVFFNTPQHAVVTGVVIGLLGDLGWEVVEAILASMGAQISNAPTDTVFDVVLGVSVARRAHGWRTAIWTGSSGGPAGAPTVKAAGYARNLLLR